MKVIRWMVLGAVLCVSMLTAMGCNTVRGVGKDIEKAGEKIQRSTEK